MHIRFLGAAGEVTGSRHLLEVAAQDRMRRFLVDCGMFQGARDADEKNIAPLAVAPHELDFVILTHAHIDHSGWLPRLCAQGFQKKIYCTPASLELLEVLLMDSAHLQALDRKRAENRKAAGKWRGDLPEPLYSTEEVEKCLSQVETVAYEKTFHPAPEVSCTFHDAGHILGSSIAELKITETEPNKIKSAKTVVFSGDIGTRGRPLMHDPKRIAAADVLVVESTYGDRLHRTLKETEDELAQVITSTLARGGNVVMPAFAVGRTQEVIFILLKLIRDKRIPQASIFVDSPMATAASKITERFMNGLDPESQILYHWYLDHQKDLHIRYLTEVEDSKNLNQVRSGAIILSASGMCEAGRIVHHLYWNLPRPQSAVVITGFQAAGTRGRQLVDKAPSVRLLGKDVPVKASIHTLGGLSAHADQADLIWWLRGFEKPPEKVFVVHGEPKAAENFAAVMQEELHWKAPILPQRGSLHPC